MSPVLKAVRVRSFDPSDLLEFVEWADHVVEFHQLGGKRWLVVRRGSEVMYYSERV